MLKIGEFSKLAKVSVKTLRYYDELGMFSPSFVDPYTAYRYYDEEKLSDINLILSYKSAGLSNSEIKLLTASSANKKTVFEHRRNELINERDELNKKIAEIERLLINDSFNITAEIKSIPSCTVFSSKGYVVSPESIPAFIKKSHNDFSKEFIDIVFPKEDYCAVIYPSSSYREKNIYIEYVQSVTKKGSDTKAFSFRSLEEITAVCIMHKGGYESLRDSYYLAVSYAKKNGYSISGDARERYLKGAWNGLQKQDWQTEIQIPVSKKEGI